MNALIKIQKPDVLGILASGLCMIHCMATPFLFVAKACSASSCAEAPLWWRFVDYAFLVISFIAIYYTSKNSTKKWVRFALWICWVLVLASILNESVNTDIIPSHFIFLPAFSIVGLHYYNLKYCSCKADKCCASHAHVS